MSPEHWPPFFLPDYLGSDHFLDQMFGLASELNHAFTGVSGEDAVFEAVADFVDRAHCAKEAGEPFDKLFPNESAVRMYIEVAAKRNALRSKKKKQKEATYGLKRQEGATVEGLDALVVAEEAEKQAQIIAYIAQIFHNDSEETVGLSRREREVLRRMWLGETAAEIARSLRLSRTTISRTRANALQKMRRHLLPRKSREND